MELGDAEFGEVAMQFYRKATGSVHVEHSLVFYSAGLLIKAYIAVHPECNLPIADCELEKVYKYFDENISLNDRFEKYATNDSYFKSQVEERLCPKIK